MASESPDDPVKMQISGHTSAAQDENSEGGAKSYSMSILKFELRGVLPTLTSPDQFPHLSEPQTQRGQQRSGGTSQK